MLTIEIVINYIRMMGVHVAISCRYCIAFEVMLLFLVLSYIKSDRAAIIRRLLVAISLKSAQLNVRVKISTVYWLC